jgi:hypothetical protein
MYEIKKTKNRNSPINKELPCQKCVLKKQKRKNQASHAV